MNTHAGRCLHAQRAQCSLVGEARQMSVQVAIERNAAAVILYHNHPSGNPEPSAADVALTQTLKQALDLIGTRVLDHLICGETVTSLSQRGLC